MTVTTNFTCNAYEKTSLKSQEDTDLKDEARIIINGDENQVLFTQEAIEDLENENDFETLFKHNFKYNKIKILN